MDKGNENLF